MIGNQVRVITNDGYPSSGAINGELRKLDAAGATIYRNQGLDNGNVFIPMQRIREILDMGRRP